MQESEQRETRRVSEPVEVPPNRQKIPMELVIAVSIVGTWDLTVCQLFPSFPEWQENEQ